MQIVVLMMMMPMKLTLSIKWIMKCNVRFRILILTGGSAKKNSWIADLKDVVVIEGEFVLTCFCHDGFAASESRSLSHTSSIEINA